MVMPIPRIVQTLTGNARGRVTCFGAVVMQVEVRCDAYGFTELLNTYTTWRDAHRDDLTRDRIFSIQRSAGE